jgi:hypothetical protein
MAHHRDSATPNGALIMPLLGSFHSKRQHIRCGVEGCKTCAACNSLQCGSKVVKDHKYYRCRRHRSV